MKKDHLTLIAQATKVSCTPEHTGMLADTEPTQQVPGDVPL